MAMAADGLTIPARFNIARHCLGRPARATPDKIALIVVGNIEAPSTVFFNDGSGRHYTPVHFGDNKGTVYGFAIADLDGDGLVDIAAARSDAPNVVYFANRPSANVP